MCHYLWLCMAMYDIAWLSINMYDYWWLNMTMYDCVWLCLTMYDRPGKVVNPSNLKGEQEKTSLKFCFVNISAIYESRMKVLYIFPQPYSCRLQKSS